MSPNDPPPSEESLTPTPGQPQPLADAQGVQPTLPPGWQGDLDLPERPIAQEPRWPHPNFWWAFLWCVLFFFITQIPGSVIAVCVALLLSLVAPDKFSLGDLSNQSALLKSDAMNIGLAVGIPIIQLTVIGFSLLVIRLVVGRDWTRQLALRRPSVTHTLLTLASLPVLILAGSAAYGLLRNSGRVPCVSQAGILDVTAFWMAVFAVLIAAILVSLAIGGWGWTRRLASRPPRGKDVLFAAVIVPILLLLIALLYDWLHNALAPSVQKQQKIGGMEEVMQLAEQWPWAFAVLVIGFGPGIGEELWFRGFLGRGLVGNYAVVLGVLASAFYFGFVHGDPCQGTAAMVMGLWLHFVYLTTRSLWLPMLLHTLNNSLGVLLSRWPKMAEVDAEITNLPILIYVTAGLLLAAVAYALYQGRARLQAETPDQPLVWRPRYQGVEYPPPGCGTHVVRPLPPLALALAGGAFVLFIVACVTSPIGK